jgi:hypothetical protein
MKQWFRLKRLEITSLFWLKMKQQLKNNYWISVKTFSKQLSLANEIYTQPFILEKSQRKEITLDQINCSNNERKNIN